MYNITNIIDKGIHLYTFEFKKRSSIIFREFPKFLNIYVENTDFAYLLRRSSWLKNENLTHVKEDFTSDKEVEHLSHASLFLFDDYFGNYLHYFLETFPKLEYFMRIKESIPDLKLIVPDFMWDVSFIKESILLYFDNNMNDVVVLSGSKHYTCDRLLIPSNVYLWPDKGYFSSIIHDSFKTLSNKVTIDDKKEGVYISRQDIVKLGWRHNRHLQNELELIDKIKTKFDYDIIELYDLNMYDKIKVFKSYNNIIQTNGAAMINLLVCQPNTNYHIISHPLYGPWANPILRDSANRLGVNFYDYDYAKLLEDHEPIVGDTNNRPWRLENIDHMLSRL